MSELTQALGLSAQYYNLVLVAIVIFLFLKLFKAHKKTGIGYITPWVWVFLAVLVYVAEAVFTVLRSAGAFNLPHHVNGYFELVIISFFIYALLLNREHLKGTGDVSRKLPPVPRKRKARKKAAKKKR